MYVVMGVTGHTGKVAAETLLDRGKKVRVVVRDSAKAKPFAARGAETAVAGLTDAKALAAAFAGAAGAYVLIPPNYAVPSFPEYQRKVATAIAAAARDAKLPHVVLLSSIGAHLPSGTGPIVGLYHAENSLRELPATKATFLRAGYFMENLGGALATLEKGFVPSFFPTSAKIDMIATKDIGAFAAELLIEGASKTAPVNLGGPGVSMSDVASALTKITGKPITVQEAPLEAVVPTFTGFGLPVEVAELYREMIGGFRTGRIQWEKEPRHVPGKTSVEEVLRGLLGK